MIARDLDFAALGRALAGQHLDELALAIAGDAGDADDLAAAHGERHVMDGDCAGIVECPQLVERQPHAAGLARAWRLDGQLLRADHGARHRVRREVLHQALAGELAAAKNRHLVSKRHHLAEFVGDHQNGQLAIDHHLSQHAQHLVGFARRQHRGRLVQDQESALQIELFQDFALLPLAGGDIGNPGIERNANGIRDRKASSSFFSFVQSTTAGTSSRASTRFSATVMAGTSVKCW